MAAGQESRGSRASKHRDRRLESAFRPRAKIGQQIAQIQDTNVLGAKLVLRNQTEFFNHEVFDRVSNKHRSLHGMRIDSSWTMHLERPAGRLVACLHQRPCDSKTQGRLTVRHGERGFELIDLHLSTEASHSCYKTSSSSISRSRKNRR